MGYREAVYKDYLSQHVHFTYNNYNQKFLDNFLPIYRAYFKRLLPKDKNAKIVDLGCGCGSFLYFLNKEGYLNTLGVDCSQEQVDLAHKLGIKSVICENLVDTVKKHNQEFDVIVAIDVLEHFKRDELFILVKSMRDALKPGGILIIRSPNADGPFFGRYRYIDFTHEIVFTKLSITELLVRSGFHDVKVYPVNPVIHGLFSFVRYLIWQAFRYILILYLTAETGHFKGHIFTLNLIAVGKRPKT